MFTDTPIELCFRSIINTFHYESSFFEMPSDWSTDLCTQIVTFAVTALAGSNVQSRAAGLP